jgi:hypothetical protein
MSTFWRNILSPSSGLKWPCLEMDIYIRARIGPEEEKVACSLLLLTLSLSLSLSLYIYIYIYIYIYYLK